MTAMSELFSAQGPIARVVPGFRPRRGQLEMAEAVQAAIADQSQLIVEAGTGTGKTFAYLIPALLSGRRVLVSTGTRTLQDQLYHRDLPQIAQALGRPVQVALLKGRTNYLCRHRLAQARSGLPGLERSPRALSRIEAWARSTAAGDIGELPGVSEGDPVWPLVTSTRENCLGQTCPDYGNCFVVRARREAQAAELVIVNHHLLLADMALKEEGFGELLPGADAVILDEAHQFPDVAAQFFGLHLSSRAIAALIRDAGAALIKAGLASEQRLVDAIHAAQNAAASALGHSQLRIAWDALPDPVLDEFDAIEAALNAFATRFTGEAAPPDADLRQCGRRALESAGRIDELKSIGAEAGLRFVETSRAGFSLSFTPFEVAERIQAHVRARPCAWIYTSATLAIGDDFSHFRARIGATEARARQIPSPFDYERNARLYLPAGLPEPSTPGYTDAALTAALPLIRAAGGRTFVLFTSHRALGEGARWLRNALGESAFPLLIQGEAPRDVLLRRFRELGHAVLLGTGSFWEGVDVRGPALSVVVIDKLPFASPDDPLLKARLEGLKRAGQNPFLSYQLPQAVLALKQGVGRLIRDSEDVGVVVLCDPRLRSKGYGRSFIASLPPMTLTETETEAIEFLRRHLGPVPSREIS
jgi:ATP-dependent DNA helicase DinG